MFVVAKIQHRPEFFWSVIGRVLKSTSVLNTCTSAMYAGRDCRADLILECDRMVRASCNLGSAETEDSHEATLDNVMLPVVDLGKERAKEAISVDNMVTLRFSSSITGAGTGLDVEDPIIYVCVDVDVKV
jgi:hypothetical protein